MRVTIESGPGKDVGRQYGLRIHDGYRAGQWVRNPGSEHPLLDTDKRRLACWARNTGYEVVSTGGRLESGSRFSLPS